jgi:hypothetical protein
MKTVARSTMHFIVNRFRPKVLDSWGRLEHLLPVDGCANLTLAIAGRLGAAVQGQPDFKHGAEDISDKHQSLSPGGQEGSAKDAVGFVH